MGASRRRVTLIKKDRLSAVFRREVGENRFDRPVAENKTAPEVPIPFGECLEAGSHERPLADPKFGFDGRVEDVHREDGLTVVGCRLESDVVDRTKIAAMPKEVHGWLTFLVDVTAWVAGIGCVCRWM